MATNEMVPDRAAQIRKLRAEIGEHLRALGFARDDEETVESLPNELPGDASEGGILESYRRGVYTAAVPTVLASLGIDLGASDWSGPGPLDAGFARNLRAMAA